MDERAVLDLGGWLTAPRPTPSRGVPGSHDRHLMARRLDRRTYAVVGRNILEPDRRVRAAVCEPYRAAPGRALR
ncbi:hypothetical protein [Pseudonocardia sp.]|uniref:hypothetical protein n=1 Tax=Pseudonocardia sp. TaxID=60912 RepID=UPI0031FD3D76